MTTAEFDDQTKKTAENLLGVIRELVAEVHPNRPPTESITLDSTFEKDLGLDSLARVELICRAESRFKLALPERTFAEVETARDLLRALLGAAAPRAALSAADMQVMQMGDAEAAPAEAQTLVDVLNWHVTQHPDRPHIQMYQDEGGGDIITFRQLKTGAARVAAGLQQLGLKPTETVSIMLPSGPEYFYSFFGALMAGGIPVPIYPPARLSQLEDHMRRHTRILANCLTRTLITVAEAKRVAQRGELPAHGCVARHLETKALFRICSRHLQPACAFATYPLTDFDTGVFTHFQHGKQHVSVRQGFTDNQLCRYLAMAVILADKGVKHFCRSGRGIR